MDEYILFVDETLKTVTNPYFCMGGICVQRKVYENTVTTEINHLKQRHFNSTDIIFHYTEMNAKTGAFEIFKDPQARSNFWNDYSSTIRDLDFVSFGVYFDQTKMTDIFCNKIVKCYHIAFFELLKNYLHYLKNVNGRGSICIESRTFKENFDLQQVYFDMIKNGSIYYSKLDFERHLSSLGFVVKGDNCIGLQIADFLPSALLREINKHRDFGNLGSTYRKKLYCHNTDLEDIFGMRNLL